MKNQAPPFTHPGMKNQTAPGVGGVKCVNKYLYVEPTTQNLKKPGVGGKSNPNALSVFDLNSKGNGDYKAPNSRSISSMINSKMEM